MPTLVWERHSRTFVCFLHTTGVQVGPVRFQSCVVVVINTVKNGEMFSTYPEVSVSARTVHPALNPNLFVFYSVLSLALSVLLTNDESCQIQERNLHVRYLSWDKQKLTIMNSTVFS